MKYFKCNYNRTEFYSIMGKYFAERNYRKLMPYLVNDDKTEWIIKTNKENEVLGFISFIERKDKITIGYLFVEEIENSKDIQDEIIMEFYNQHVSKEMYAEVEKHFDIDIYLDLGFEVIKESTNYYYLVRRKPYEII